MAMVSIVELPKYEAYKDSGFDWLGKIPSSWELISLKHLLQFHTGGTPSSGNQQFYDGNLPWITIADLNGRYTNQSHFLSRLGVRQARIPLTPKGSLLYSFKLSIGQVAFAGTDLYTNEAIASFLPRNGLNLRYYFYALPIFLENNAATNIYGAKLLNQDLINNASILKVCSTDQLLIADFLDKKTTQIDEAIAIKEEQIALLKERKQIIIQKAVTQGLDPNVPMKDSGVDWIGQIPEHWEVIKLKHLFSEVTSRTKTGTETLFSLRMEIGLVPHDDVSDKHIPSESLVDYKIVKSGQMVMNRMRAAIGIFGLATDYGLVSPDYAVFDVASDVVPDYYLTLFKLPLMGTQFRLASKGMGTGSSGFMRLYTDEFGDIKVANPPKEEQEALVRFIAETNRATDLGVDHLRSQIEKLKEYKTTLINSAVTGKIKITPEMVEQ